MNDALDKVSVSCQILTLHSSDCLMHILLGTIYPAYSFVQVINHFFFSSI